MSDDRILQLNEAELYPIAKKYFMDYSGLDASKEKHRRMISTAEKVRLDGLLGINVRAVVSRWDGECISNGKLVKEGTALECRAFSQIPDGSVKQIYAFAVTAGECLYNDDDPITNQLFADTWGTTYVDVARMLLEKAFKEEMALNFKGQNVSLSAHFGPGFYGMPITENITLCRLLSADSIGIHTKDNGLMIPLKSCSGLYFATCDTRSLPKQSCEQCVGNAAGCAYCVSENSRKNK